VHYASRAGEEVTVIPCFPATAFAVLSKILLITNTQTGQRKQAATMSQIAIL